MTGEDETATEFNKKFVDIGPSLAKLFPNPSLPLESFLKRVNITLHSQSLDWKMLFFLWKQAKALELMK